MRLSLTYSREKIEYKKFQWAKGISNNFRELHGTARDSELALKTLIFQESTVSWNPVESWNPESAVSPLGIGIDMILVLVVSVLKDWFWYGIGIDGIGFGMVLVVLILVLV